MNGEEKEERRKRRTLLSTYIVPSSGISFVVETSSFSEEE